MAQAVKRLPALWETGVRPLGQEDPLEEEIATHFSILGKFHGQRLLESYSPWDRKQLDRNEHTHTC